jgi:2-polyprenyl-3-methyl-5-hydroxy-6-metoxy-1,4-benzoquinol methylase
MNSAINHSYTNDLTLRQELLQAWRLAVCGDHGDSPIDAVVDELAEYFEIGRDEVLRRCRNWESDSLNEWNAEDRTTPEGLLHFYQTQTSWIFDTMWYHAEQCSESKPAESVDIAEGLLEHRRDWDGAHHLDFGAGPGTSSLFFRRLGWEVSLADVSTSFLNFARWRLDRHRVAAKFYDSSRDELPDSEFDLITALDVMVHVPDIGATLRRLNAALKPGGYLVFNIDNRPCTETTQWHLYAEQFPILRQVRRAGFQRCPKIRYFHVYRKIDRSDSATALVSVADMLRYNPLTTLAGKVVRLLRRR